MLRITVDLLSAKLPCAAARALVRHAWGTKAPNLQLINCRKVRRSVGINSAINSSIHDLLIRIHLQQRRLRLRTPLFCCLAV